MPVEDPPARPAPVNQGRIVHLNFTTTAGIRTVACPCSSTLEHLLRLQEIQVQFLREGTTSPSCEIHTNKQSGPLLENVSQTGFLNGQNTACPNRVAKLSELK